jgi:hypothetical protein
MSLITEEQAIELAREFLEDDGEKIIELLSIDHTTKETYEHRLNEPFEFGNIFIEFSVALPPDAKFVEDAIRTIQVNDVTGKTDYFMIL